MYTNIQSAVINNGNTCEFFPLQRGVRQGCPMSAYLFILALEVLAHSIRGNELIKGFKINNTEIKLSMLADDMTCILGDVGSVKYTLDTLNLFKNCSGLRINLDKTTAKYIGCLKGWDYYPHGLSWIKKPIETLGVIFTGTDTENYNYNFAQRIKNLNTTLDIWSQRNLSIKGKITILNNLALSPLIYISSVIHTPQRAIDEVNKLIANFIWSGKNAKISRKTLSQSIDNGGLKLCDFKTKVEALTLSWVNRLVNMTNANWKVLPKIFFGNVDMNVYFNAHQKIIKKNDTIPLYYKNIHNLWNSQIQNDPFDTKDILKESLWLNKHITSNNQPLYKSEWVNHGITHIRHLLNDQGEFLDHTELSQKYKLSCNFLSLLQVRQCIPYEWRQNLKHKDNLSPKSQNSQILVNINGSIKPIIKIKCKDIYWHLINNDKHIPSAVRKWPEIFPLFKTASDEVWTRIWELPFQTTRETKIPSFQYKLIHRTIACNKWLFDIKIKDSSKCTFCDEEDSITHYFLYCNKVKEFWDHWHNWWTYITETDFSKGDATAECILFGYPGDDDIISVLNYCVLYAKYFIHTMKMSGKNDLDLYHYLRVLKQKMLMEKQVCIKTGNSNLFNKFKVINDSL